jgi:Sugar (and other) transporter
MSGDRSTTLGDSNKSLFRNPGTGPRYLPPDPEHRYQPVADTPRSPLYDADRPHDLENDSEIRYGSDAPHSSPHDAERAVVQIEALPDEKQGLSTWWLYASIGAVAFVYSLDQNVTGNYLPIATSAYDRHSILGTINTAESIISELFVRPLPCLFPHTVTHETIDAVAKPFIAKIADVTSRPNAYSVTLVFYVLGYLLIAGSTVVEEVVAGMLIYTVGHSGLNLVTELLVADLSSLKWRGLVLSLTSLPFLVNTFLGAEIVHTIIESGNWRWGCEYSVSLWWTKGPVSDFRSLQRWNVWLSMNTFFPLILHH